MQVKGTEMIMGTQMIIVLFKLTNMSKEKLTIGRNLLIPSEAKLIDAPSKIEYFGKHYEMVIAIGKHHTASLIISEEALNALNEYKNQPSVEI